VYKGWPSAPVVTIHPSTVLTPVGEGDLAVPPDWGGVVEAEAVRPGVGEVTGGVGLAAGG
jgi:hypothetical protein